ncbi:hypothetical protein FACS1894103_2500 [Campylobacterota bacterium]|nr:hypothetical protein FACS1894103_2500 [Campylobacterota bacterium]
MVIKRLADWLEKISVAGLAVGLFQADMIGIITAILAFCGTMALTEYIQRKETKWAYGM